MATKMWAVAYPAAVKPGVIQISIFGANASQAGGAFLFFGPGTSTAIIQPDAGGAHAWTLTAAANAGGPTLSTPTQTLQPSTMGPPPAFHFSLSARATNPVTDEDVPVLIVVKRDGQILTGTSVDGQGHPIQDTLVEMAGKSIDFYLEV